MQCRKCKAEMPDDGKFCPYCGTRQDRESRKALKRANGTGTVYKLQGRRRRPWLASKNKTIIGYYETKTAALEALNRLSGRSLDERYNMTFAEVFDAWKAEHYKTITIQAQKSYDKGFDLFKSLHAKKFRDLRTSDFQIVIDEHKSKPEAAKKYKQLIGQMSTWAMREELITTNFAKFVQLPSSTKKEKEIFTEEEIQRIEEDGSETARIILMLLATGMRIGELFSLPLKDYHETYVIGGSKTEAGRNRVIPIRPEGRIHFAYFAKKSAGMDFLIGGYEGNKDRNNFRNREYNPLLERLGINKEKTPHSTRHTYASRAVKEGMEPEILQKILGHADFSTTANVYTHVDIATLVKSVER